MPGNHLMVDLLGEHDDLLRRIEAAFPVTILVRGNEITVTGDAESAERVGRLFEELVVLVEQGHAARPRRHRPRDRDGRVRPASERRAAHRGRAGPQERPPEDGRTEALRRRGARPHRHVRDRAGRHRQELPRGRARGAGAPGEGREPHHPHAPRGGGGGAARLPARRHAREGRPVPASALRRALRHARPRDGRAPRWTAA